MKKRSLWIITALMTLALLGVFVMQVYYIRESYKLNSRLFEENVNQALNAVVNKIQKKNVVTSINRKDDEARRLREEDLKSKTDTIVAFKVRFKDSESQRKYRQQQQMLDYILFQDSSVKATFLSPFMITEEEYRIYSNPNSSANNKLGLDIEDIKDVNGNLISRRVRPRFLHLKTNLQQGKLPDTIRYIAFSPQNWLPHVVSFPSKDPDMMAKFKVEDAKASKKYQMELDRLYADTANLFSNNSFNLVQDVAKELDNKNVPLEDRIPSKKILDTLLRRELLSKNIKLAYNYWLTPAKDKNRIIYQNVSHAINEPLPKNTFEHVVFSNDVVINDPGMLYVSFPNVSSLIFSNMFATLASSVALLLVLIFIFTYTILAIIRQKKLSEMKTDFINNMTHEFKTPVATIMIASEALKDPEVVEDKTRISRLANIIYDENVRLGNHIERVLSVARLEKKEIKLEYAPVNVNDLITAVVDSMGLQLQKRNAQVTLNLNSADDLVMGDELHLSNVIYNLIDNANKYSLNEPKITISTRSTIKNLYIQVADEGIGMTKDQTKRIFDQFYRVHTGNLHDVKGFGLGLNYVQDILMQMGGSIKVQSEKDKGTTFEVIIPFKHSN
ncbi:HAMP domain-containing sensor histidine kinase [Pedobacter sp. KR3-3]|uniref:histidine kinase n=1 Tax=Pedobacter albus TaxID=3113905 RepID=A0ABU7I9Y5_9SPHI|nr:HAMP domain-containing sensor histidine kinase [Pedobacter sp. KR3-3]MEE1946174.1 HAMP domain-containing sensor histidine kinase [Pedobacter sp. KR3-3]